MAQGTTVQIPAAQYIEDIPSYLEGRSVDETLHTMSRHLSLFQAVEQDLLQSKARMLTKVPDIQRSLKVVELLQRKRAAGQQATFDFSLAGEVYAKATVRNITSVNLWLGANVMLEYPLDEAKALLDEQLENALTSLDRYNKEADKIKDFITTTQVNQARIYNHDVVARRKSGAKSKDGG